MTPIMRLSAATLALLLGAQAIGKLLDVGLYVIALERFHTFPQHATRAVATAWVFVELAALAGLGVAASTGGRPKAVWILGAASALLDTVAYAALTIGTSVRGIVVLNCTCFGAHLPQRLSAFVLVQDILMVAWASWVMRASVLTQM
jgi:methylamine utilization protein MauE